MKTRRLLANIVVVSVVLAISILLSLARRRVESIQGEPTGNTYTEEDMMARYTRDRMMYRTGEEGEITWFKENKFEILKPEKSKYCEILKKVLAEYPQSSFAPAWQLAIATETNKLEDFQKVVHQYPGNDFICAIAYTKMGEIYRSKGKDAGAEASFQKALTFIDQCIMNEPQNAAYNYHKAIIKVKQRNETFHWEKLEGKLMPPDISSELKEGTKKDYCYTPYLELNNINEDFKSSCELLGGLLAQAAYYGQRGEADKDIETCKIMLKMGKHYWDENQNLVREKSVGLEMCHSAQILLTIIFEQKNMLQEKEKLETANKIVKERIDKIKLIRILDYCYVKVILNKDLSDLPPEERADPEKAIREAREEAVDIIEKDNLIKDKNLEARIFISYLLSRLGGEKAMAILKKGLNDKDSYVRFFVKKILEEH